MLGVILTLAAIGLVAYFVIKNYYPPIILLLIGLVLLSLRIHGCNLGLRQRIHTLLCFLRR